MRHIVAILLAGAVSVPILAIPVPAASSAPTLAAVHGRERVLILIAPAAGDRRLATQDGLLAADPAALRERDLRLVRVAGDRVSGLDASAMALRARFGVARDAFALRLVGKDGHVALARADPIAPAELFAAIDAMPMRREEMRARR